MDWICNYQLFLFDFDGILVDSEQLHYEAYRAMCTHRGFPLTWDKQEYLRYALYTPTGVQKALYSCFPLLYQQEPNWSILYQEKKELYLHLVEKKGICLMPGIETLLLRLSHQQITCCVVTHSSRLHTNQIREKLPVLDLIPHWITREDYSLPKPDPSCYLQAIQRFQKPGDRIIGFEDSPRGLQALLHTHQVESVLVSDILSKKEIEDLQLRLACPFSHYSSFEQMDLVVEKPLLK